MQLLVDETIDSRLLDSVDVTGTRTERYAVQQVKNPLILGQAGATGGNGRGNQMLGARNLCRARFDADSWSNIDNHEARPQRDQRPGVEGSQLALLLFVEERAQLFANRLLFLVGFGLKPGCVGVRLCPVAELEEPGGVLRQNVSQFGDLLVSEL